MHCGLPFGVLLDPGSGIFADRRGRGAFQSMRDITVINGLSIGRTIRMHIDLEYEAIIQSNLMSNVFPNYRPSSMLLLALHLDITLNRSERDQDVRHDFVPSKLDDFLCPQHLIRTESSFGSVLGPRLRST